MNSVIVTEMFCQVNREWMARKYFPFVPRAKVKQDRKRLNNALVHVLMEDKKLVVQTLVVFAAQNMR